VLAKLATTNAVLQLGMPGVARFMYKLCIVLQLNVTFK